MCYQMDLIAEDPNCKIVVYSHSLEMLNICHSICTQEGWPAFLVYLIVYDQQLNLIEK